MKSKTMLLAVSLVVLVARPLWAQEQNPDPNLMGRMEQKLAESGAEARDLKGGPQAVWLLRKVEIENTIDRLNSGESVDPKQIDRILEGQVNY